MNKAERDIRRNTAKRALNSADWSFEPDTKERYPGQRILAQVGALIMHDRIIDNYVRRPL